MPELKRSHARSAPMIPGQLPTPLGKQKEFRDFLQKEIAEAGATLTNPLTYEFLKTSRDEFLAAGPKPRHILKQNWKAYCATKVCDPTIAHESMLKLLEERRGLILFRHAPKGTAEFLLAPGAVVRGRRTASESSEATTPSVTTIYESHGAEILAGQKELFSKLSSLQEVCTHILAEIGEVKEQLNVNRPLQPAFAPPFATR